MGGRARRGARARRRRPQEPRDLSDKIWSVFCWVVPPVFALVLLVVSIADLGPAFAARRGEGTYGSFRGEERRCHETRYGTSCDELWGTFRPEDGTPERYVRHLEPPEGFGVGGRIRALLADEARDEVYRTGGTYQWLVTVGGIAVAVGTMGVWLWMLNRRID